MNTTENNNFYRGYEDGLKGSGFDYSLFTERTLIKNVKSYAKGFEDGVKRSRFIKDEQYILSKDEQIVLAIRVPVFFKKGRVEDNKRSLFETIKQVTDGKNLKELEFAVAGTVLNTEYFECFRGAVGVCCFFSNGKDLELRDKRIPLGVKGVNIESGGDIAFLHSGCDLPCHIISIHYIPTPNLDAK